MNGPRARKRRLRVPVYVSESVYYAWIEAADTTGQTLSQFAAAAISERIERVARMRLRSARQRRRTSANPDAEREAD